MPRSTGWRVEKQEEEGREGHTPQTTLNFDARVYRPVLVDQDKRFEGTFVVAVKLRLVRMGKKKQPTYRVVAAESRRARSGAFLEIVGTYEPRGLSDAQPETVFSIDNEKVLHWLQQGAQPTERVAKLLKASGALEAPSRPRRSPSERRTRRLRRW